MARPLRNLQGSGASVARSRVRLLTPWSGGA